MKKVIFSFCLMLTVSASYAQSGLFDKLKNVAGSAAESVINNSLGNAIQADVKGTWSYKGVAVATTSDDVLTNVASSAAAGTIESKLDEYLAKAGIKPGAATFTFNEDNSFNFTVGKIAIPGTWSQEGNALTLKFGKALQFLQMDGTVKSTLSGELEILFNADKMVDFAGKAVEFISSKTGKSALGSMSDLVGKIDGAQAGFKLAK